MKSLRSCMIVFCILLLAGSAGANGVAPPTADFTANITTGPAPLTVQFTDDSAGTPDTFAWFFGDETYSEAWTRVNASSGWAPREGLSGVLMQNGRVLIMGGHTTVIPYQFNESWQSADNGAHWTLVNASPGWVARSLHSSVVMPDGSIVLAGGLNNAPPYYYQDVWRSTDMGSTWSRMTPTAGWAGRHSQGSVALPDGSLLLMGGLDINNFRYNDTWRSTNNGSSWTRITASSVWPARQGFSSVVMPDGSIVLMGGRGNASVLNDTWRSTDNGVTWQLMNASSGWQIRQMHSSVVMPDGSIVLMGGSDAGVSAKNDTWRSTDNGATWTRLPDPGWTARFKHAGVATGDGSILVIGGQSGTPLNDTWRLYPVGSSQPDPTHTFTAPGTYTVTLQVMNNLGYNSSRRTAFIKVTGMPRIGVFQDGGWALDDDGSFSWNAGDRAYSFGAGGDTPVTGDWNRDGVQEIGTFNSGTWYLDYNGNGVYDGPSDDRAAAFGSAGFRPVTGDWNGDGTDEIGVQADGIWAVDYNGNLAWDGDVTDRFAAFGQAGDIPVIGDWNGDHKSEIGSHLDGFWAIDYNGNYAWDGVVDDRFAGLGQAADKPVIGDWNGDGRDKIGMETNGFWATDYNGNYVWDGIGDDRFAGLGQSGDTPVVGDWDYNGKTEICSFTDGFWAIDYNGNYAWDGIGDDRFAGFGSAGAVPVVGAWS